MNQKLFKQIKNEWRSNLWLCLELLVVSVVMWYVADYLWTSWTLYSEPRGFDISHCYVVGVEAVSEKSPDFIADASNEQVKEWRAEIVERLRRRPEIEVVAQSLNSYPYNGSNNGSWYTCDTLRTNGFIIQRKVTPDFVRVFRYTGVNGETPEELAAILSRGELLMSDNFYNQYRPDRPAVSRLVGKEAYEDGDTTHLMRIGAALNTVKYADFFQGDMNRTVVHPVSDQEGWFNEVVVRVRDNMDRDFIEKLRADADPQFRVGNLFLADVRSMADIRDSYQMSRMTEIRNYVTGMSFLLLNIFLGLLGTFWFRTQQRTRDIAVRKVSGATSRDILSLFIGEGLLLLTLVTPIAVAIDINLAYLELNTWYDGSFLTWDRILVCAGATYVIMALMISVGILIPAARAMHITPATALHDE